MSTHIGDPAAPETGNRDLAALLKVLGDANRLAIVLTIGAGCRSVSEIVEATRLPQTLVSFHLRTLRRAALVRTVRRGAFVFYSLVEPGLLELLGEFAHRTRAGFPVAGRGDRG